MVMVWGAEVPVMASAIGSDLVTLPVAASAAFTVTV
jgi:hypothetical protein